MLAFLTRSGGCSANIQSEWQTNLPREIRKIQQGKYYIVNNNKNTIIKQDCIIVRSLYQYLSHFFLNEVQ